MGQLSEYTSKWKPLYEEYVELRLNWDTLPPAKGGGGPRFALSLLMQNWNKAKPPQAKAAEYKRAPAVRGCNHASWFDEAINRWGKKLARLHEATGQLEPQDGDVLDDAYHCALKISLCPFNLWQNGAAYLSPDGLFPELPAGVKLELAFSDLLKLKEKVAYAESHSAYLEGFDPSRCPRGEAEETVSAWMAKNRELQFFRGQRKDYNTWTLQSTLDRDAGARRAEMVSRTANAAATFEQDEGVSFNQACGLIQHYGYELGLNTHLMDVTLEPLVALYFATRSSEKDSEANGVVSRWSLTELEKLGVGKNSILGNLSIFSPGDELRICRQRGLFLAAPSPEVINQTFQWSLYFHQRPGILFEDPSRNITCQFLEGKSPWLRKLQRAVDYSTTATPDRVSTVDGCGPLTEQLLLEYVKQQAGALWNSGRGSCMKLLVALHLLNTSSKKGVPACRSLRLLNSVAHDLLSQAECCSETIPMKYAAHAGSSEEAGKLWELWRSIVRGK